MNLNRRNFIINTVVDKKISGFRKYRYTRTRNLMRIALCLEYPIQTHGGVSVLVETLLREFAARGNEIVLVSPDVEKTVRELEISKWIYKHIQFYPKKKSIADAKTLARQIAAAKPDVAHFHSGGVFV